MNKVNKRKILDLVLVIITYLSSLIAVLILGAIMFFIFNNGLELLSFDLITKDYHSKPYQLNLVDEVNTNNFVDPNIDDAYFSNRFGFAVKDDLSLEGLKVIRFIYVDENSPLLETVNVLGEKEPLLEGYVFDSTLEVTFSDSSSQIVFSRSGAKSFVETVNDAVMINNIVVKEEGGGIRGSIITTFYLIIITLIIALPLGILTAVYLHEIAPKNKVTNILRSLIDMLTGVPSIIFGLMGAALFIPFTSILFNNNDMKRGSLIAGALTLVVIVLPVIIKSTETALDVVPKGYKEASLALGATKTQTTFRVMLPNALPGILSAAILSIGRIIGESAALIFAMGTFIGDSVSITGRSTSLAVHIWSVMGGEIPNIKLASSIAIIILIVVLSLNMLVKLLTSFHLKKVGR